MKFILMLSILFGLLFCETSFAQDAMVMEQNIRNKWQHAFWQITDRQEKIKALQALEIEAKKFQSLHPQRAEATIWYGVVLASEASLIRNASIIRKSKQARDLFLKSIDMDPNAMKGAAHRMLGTLYHQVPGWPLSYGDDKKAEYHFQQALRIAPESKDAHFLYANFLADKKRFTEAFDHVRLAEEAPEEAGYPLANVERDTEIVNLRNRLLKMQRP